MKVTSRYLGCVLGSEGELAANQPWKAILCTAAAIALLTIALPIQAQTGEKPGRVGLPEDWTHRHVVFSGGSSLPPEATRAVVSDARFWHQQLRRAARPVEVRPEHRRNRKRRVDWSVNLGGSNARLAAGTFPAKYTFDINATPDCTNDFVVFALNVAGSASQATIVAYNNLYTEPGGTGFCPGTGPTVKWAYNTGGAINTSPVLSLDGKKVAWVAGVGSPVLHVLTIGTTGSNGTTVTSPATPGSGNDAVDTSVSFGTLHDTRSSLFVDYSSDVGYVGSDDGNIHKFTGVFNSTPAEVIGGNWPIQGIGGANRTLTSITFDAVSRNLFYGDSIGDFAYIREVGSTRGVCISQPSPPCLGKVNYSLTSLAQPIIDAPVVDSTAQNVFVFVGNNNSGHALVQQTDTQLSTNGPQALIGQAGLSIFAGTFDNNYYSSPQSGFLYVCGYPASAAVSTPVLYRIGFNSSNNMNTTTDGNSLSLSNSASATTCSPMTEIFNPPTLKDWLFVGVGTGCTITGGGVGGCVASFDITSGFPTAPATQQARPATSGTSGIVVDNVSTKAQASSIYFTTQGNGFPASPCGDGVTGTGCAVKLTQSGLN